MLVSLLLSAVNGGEARGGRRRNAIRLGGASRFGKLVVDFGEEGGRALAGGLMVPWEKPLVQPAVRWLLRRRPLEPKFTDSLCHDMDKLLVRSGSGDA